MIKSVFTGNQPILKRQRSLFAGLTITCLVLFITLFIIKLVIIHPSSAHASTGAFIVAGNTWTYFKGIAEPPADWNTLDFNDNGWLSGPTGIGYGDGDDAIVLDDMRYNYVSVYLRSDFEVADTASLVELQLKIDYDDGFVAYLNGVEVARRGLGDPGTPIPYDAVATSHEAGEFENIDISDHLGDLSTGTNVLAIQVHNRSLVSSDLTVIPELHWVDNLPTLVRHPYLQMLGTDSVTIVWTTNTPDPCQVHYSLDLSYSQVVIASTTHKTVAAPEPYDNYYEHVAVLSGLAAETSYNYAIYCQGIELATGYQKYFRTHPEMSPNACRFDFAAFGDPGFNNQPARDVRDQALARGFDFALILGDLAYVNGTYEELEINYFNLFQDALWNHMLWPVIGNHETYTDFGAPYLDVYYLPEQALRPTDHERYYAFDYGNAHFVILDTNAPLEEISESAEDDMADWLEADLSSNDKFWTIVAMHHPWYVSDTRSHPQEIHDWLVPIFEAYDVDVVLHGHDHLYERTYPIKEETLSTVDDGGVVYITNGEACSRGTRYNFYEPAPDWSAVRSNHNYEDYDASYTHIYVDNGVMSLITIDDQGNAIDPPGGTDPLVIIDRSDEPGATCPALYLPLILRN